MPVYYELLLDDAVRSRAAAGASRSARSRGRSWPATTAPTRLAEAEEHFDRLHVERALPDSIEEAALARGRRSGPHARRSCATTSALSSSEARRLLGQGGIRLDGEQLGAGDLDVPAERLDGAVLQVGKRRHKRFHADGAGELPGA